MKGIYPAKFYKYLTEREDWDIQPEEVYGSMDFAYEQFQDYLRGLEKILKDLEAKGLKNSKEYKDTYKEYTSLASGQSED